MQGSQAESIDNTLDEKIMAYSGDKVHSSYSGTYMDDSNKLYEPETVPVVQLLPAHPPKADLESTMTRLRKLGESDPKVYDFLDKKMSEIVNSIESRESGSSSRKETDDGDREACAEDAPREEEEAPSAQKTAKTATPSTAASSSLALETCDTASHSTKCKSVSSKQSHSSSKKSKSSKSKSSKGGGGVAKSSSSSSSGASSFKKSVTGKRPPLPAKANDKNPVPPQPAVISKQLSGGGAGCGINQNMSALSADSAASVVSADNAAAASSKPPVGTITANKSAVSSVEADEGASESSSSSSSTTTKSKASKGGSPKQSAQSKSMEGTNNSMSSIKSALSTTTETIFPRLLSLVTPSKSPICADKEDVVAMSETPATDQNEKSPVTEGVSAETKVLQEEPVADTAEELQESEASVAAEHGTVPDTEIASSRIWCCSVDDMRGNLFFLEEGVEKDKEMMMDVSSPRVEYVEMGGSGCRGLGRTKTFQHSFGSSAQREQDAETSSSSGILSDSREPTTAADIAPLGNNDAVDEAVAATVEWEETKGKRLPTDVPKGLIGNTELVQASAESCQEAMSERPNAVVESNPGGEKVVPAAPLCKESVMAGCVEEAEETQKGSLSEHNADTALEQAEEGPDVVSGSSPQAEKVTPAAPFIKESAVSPFVEEPEKKQLETAKEEAERGAIVDPEPSEKGPTAIVDSKEVAPEPAEECPDVVADSKEAGPENKKVTPCAPLIQKSEVLGLVDEPKKNQPETSEKEAERGAIVDPEKGPAAVADSKEAAPEPAEECSDVVADAKEDSPEDEKVTPCARLIQESEVSGLVEELKKKQLEAAEKEAEHGAIVDPKPSEKGPAAVADAKEANPEAEKVTPLIQESVVSVLVEEPKEKHVETVETEAERDAFVTPQTSQEEPAAVADSKKAGPEASQEAEKVTLAASAEFIEEPRETQQETIEKEEDAFVHPVPPKEAVNETQQETTENEPVRDAIVDLEPPEDAVVEPKESQQEATETEKEPVRDADVDPEPSTEGPAAAVEPNESQQGTAEKEPKHDVAVEPKSTEEGPAASIELKATLQEITENGIDRAAVVDVQQLKEGPCAAIEPKETQHGTAKNESEHDAVAYSEPTEERPGAGVEPKETLQESSEKRTDCAAVVEKAEEGRCTVVGSKETLQETAEKAALDSKQISTESEKGAPNTFLIEESTVAEFVVEPVVTRQESPEKEQEHDAAVVDPEEPNPEGEDIEPPAAKESTVVVVLPWWNCDSEGILCCSNNE